jgi:uncharacterized protein with PIN domain
VTPRGADRSNGLALLFKGEDFVRTDIVAVVSPS